MIRKKIVTIEIAFRPHASVEGVPIEGFKTRVSESGDTLNCSKVVVKEEMELGTNTMGAKVESQSY